MYPNSGANTLIAIIIIIIILVILFSLFSCGSEEKKNNEWSSTSCRSRSNRCDESRDSRDNRSSSRDQQCERKVRTFNISVGSSADGTPGFEIDGNFRPTLVIKRNSAVRFKFSEPSDQYLYFATSSTGGQGAPDQIAGSPIPFNSGAVLVEFDSRYPDTFYYNSAASQNYGGTIKLK